MTDDTLSILHTQLATTRATLAELRSQADQHGGERNAPPALRAQLRAARTALTLLAADLRSRGAIVADEPEVQEMSRQDLDPHDHLRDLDQVRRDIVAAHPDDLAPIGAWLPQLWTTSLLRCCLRSQADVYPDALLVLLVQCGQLDEALMLAEQRTDPDRRTEALAHIAVELVIAGQPAAAEQVLARVSALPTSTAAEQALIAAQALTAGVAEAIRQIDMLPDTLQHDARRVAALVLGRAGRFADLLALADTCPDAEKRSRLLYIVECELLAADQLANAVRLLPAIPACRERLWALGKVAAAFARRGQLAVASACADRALATPCPPSTVIEDVSPLQGTVQALAQAGRLSEALEVAATIPAGFSRFWAQTEIALVLAQGGQHDQAAELLAANPDERERVGMQLHAAVQLAREGLLDAADALAPDGPKAARNDALLSAQVVGLVRLGRLDEALALAAIRSGARRQVQVLVEVAEVLLRTQGAAAALVVVRKTMMLVRGQPAPFWGSWGLGKLAELLARAGHAAEARAVLERMQPDDRRALAGEQVAEALARAGLLSEALALIPTIPLFASQTAARQRIMTALAQLGQVKAALQVAEGLMGESCRSASAQIARALAQAGRVAEVELFLEALPPATLPSEQILHLVRELLARRRLDTALVVARAHLVGLWLAGGLSLVVLVLTRAGRWEEARALAQEVVEALREPVSGQGQPDLVQRNAVLADVVVALGNLGVDAAVDGVMEAIRRLRGAVARRRVQVRLAVLRRGPGYVQELLVLADQLLGPVDQTEALRGLVEELVQAERWEEALAIADAMAEPSWAATARADVAVGLAEVGQVAVACAAVERIGEAQARSRALRRVVQALVERNLLVEAANYASEIDDSLERARACIALVSAQAAAERWADALSRAQQAVDLARAAPAGGREVLGELAVVIGGFHDVPTVAQFLQRAWVDATTEAELLALLPATAPLLIGEPALVGLVLAGCDWVQEQLG